MWVSMEQMLQADLSKHEQENSSLRKSFSALGEECSHLKESLHAALSQKESAFRALEQSQRDHMDRMKKLKQEHRSKLKVFFNENQHIISSWSRERERMQN